MQKLYIDMDNVLVNFQSGIDKLNENVKANYAGHLDDVPGIFMLMDPMPRAVEAVNCLAESYDLYVLSTAPWGNPSAWCDKLNWIKNYFGDDESSVLYKRLILSHHKDLCEGDYLIDDNPHKHGADKFKGKFLHFGKDGEFKDWKSILDYLLK